MAYQAVEEIQVRCEKENIPFWKAVQLEDCEENGITEEESWQQMTLMWTRMKESVDAYDPSEKSRSGLVGKEGGLMDGYLQNEKPLCGDFVSKVIANALKMGCNNACMKRIVAAPTAGACGVMPAVSPPTHGKTARSGGRQAKLSLWKKRNRYERELPYLDMRRRRTASGLWTGALRGGRRQGGHGEKAAGRAAYLRNCGYDPLQQLASNPVRPGKNLPQHAASEGKKDGAES